MKTSATQFEMLVSYMERHGDLNRPTNIAQGRLRQLKEWLALKDLLNSGASGAIKTTEKWKKVWSDFKNNTKKKAARINRAGGGAALRSKLTKLEKRVLRIMSSRAASGSLAVVGAGLSQVPDQNVDRKLTSAATENESPFSVTIIKTENPEEAATDECDLPGTSSEYHMPASQSPPPTSPHSDLTATSPVPPPQSSPRATYRVLHHVGSSDEEWKNFLRKKHEDEMEVQRKRLQIRKIELQAHQGWQNIAKCALSLLENITRNLRD